MKQKLILTITLCITNLYMQGQTKWNMTPHFDSETGEGSLHIQIAGYNTDDFCYKWSGKNGYSSTSKPPIKGLEYGVYSVRITDCNQIIAADQGTACEGGKDYSVWEMFHIEGATCDGFEASLDYYPKEVCDVESVITLFAPAVLPPCMKNPQYEWHAHGHKLAENKDYLQNQMPGQYCLHITDSKPKKKCTCEAYICQYIPSLTEDFDLVLEAKPSRARWITTRPDSTNHVLWEYAPGDIKVKIEGFSEDMEYTGTVNVKSRNDKKNEALAIDMIPGRAIDLESGAQLTNLGYGRFSVNSGQLVIGDEICIEVRDTCGNIYRECAEVSAEINYSTGDNRSKLTFTDLVEDGTVKRINNELGTIDPKKEFTLDVDEWQLTNSRHLYWKNTPLIEVFNKTDGKYFLISELE